MLRKGSFRWLAGVRQFAAPLNISQFQTFVEHNYDQERNRSKIHNIFIKFRCD